MDAHVVALSARTPVAVAGLAPEFERLFRAEYARIVRIAYRVLGDAAEAEDVAQEVLLSFYRRHRADAPYAAPWLHQAAAHAALNAVRSRARRVVREERDASGHASITDPESQAIERERAREVRTALGRMPRSAAELLALRYSGLSYAEVALATGIKADQVGTRLRRAQDAFRKEVSRGQD